MSSEKKSTSSGWMTAVGRFFRNPGKDSEQDSSSPSGDSAKSSLADRATIARRLMKDIVPTNGVSLSDFSSSLPPSTPGGLRCLNPPVESTQNSSSSKPTEDILNNKSLGVPRKRTGAIRPLVNEFEHCPKRFRGIGNSSLLEEPIHITVPDRLSTTYATPTFDASPASSVRSLKSRVSETASTTSSGVSSKTKAILQQLERVRTPTNEFGKLPLMRGGDSKIEKWAPLPSSTDVPPLCKTMGAVPSRMQLLSSSLGSHHKKPYWRDVMRKSKKPDDNGSKTIGVNDTEGTCPKQNGDSISCLLDGQVSSPPKKQVPEPRRPQPTLKGADGKRTNFFTAKDIDEDAVTTLSSLKSVPVPTAQEVPQKGFLDDVIYSFAAPKSLDAEPTMVEEEVISAVDGSSSVNSGDSSDESDSDVSSDESDSETAPEKEASSRPPTSTDSETSATSNSSKNSSPINQAVAEQKEEPNWDCPDCFISNKGSKCAACGYSKGGTSAAAPAQKTLVSNLSMFANKAPTSVSFGFGSGTKTSSDSVANSVATTAPAPSISFGASAKTTSNEMVKTSEPSSSQPASSEVPSESTEKRVDWSCPDCCVTNKATDDQCVCCGFVQYKSSTKESSSVFGDRAFKPTTGTNSYAFGTGATTSTPSVSFGFGSNTSVKKDEPAKSESSQPTTNGTSLLSSNIFNKLPSGNPTPSSGVGSLFGAGAAVAVSTPAAAISSASSVASTSSSATATPLFGGLTATSSSAASSVTSSTPFGLTSSTSSPFPAPSTSAFSIPSAPAATPATSVIPQPTISLAPAKSEASAPAAPALSLFGSPAVSSSASLFGQTPVTSLAFGKPSATGQLPTSAPENKPAQVGFGGLKPGLFGTSSTTEGGLSSTPSTGLSLFGAAKPDGAQSLFGKPAASIPEAPKPVEVPAPNAAFTFGATPSVPSITAAGTSSTTTGLFGTSNSTPSFGLFGSSGPTPSLTNSGSSASLFQPSAPKDTPFNFGAPAAAPSNQAFSFGSTVPTVDANTPFVFGSTPQPASSSLPQNPFGAPAAAPVPAFSAGSTGAAPGGAFAFSAGPSAPTQRKIAPARRRMVRK